MAGYKLKTNELGQRIKKDGTLAKPPGRVPDPSKKKVKKFNRTGPRPQVWLTGPDEYTHSLYTPWQRAYSQAAFRGEDWDITFEQFLKLWEGNWHKRGRGHDDLCMSRIDHEKAWTKKNVHLITRYDHLVALAKQRKEKKQ